jgi:hypothetical protein
MRAEWDVDFGSVTGGVSGTLSQLLGGVIAIAVVSIIITAATVLKRSRL